MRRNIDASTRRGRGQGRRRGMVSMETALVLPLLLALAMAVIEGGTMLHSWMALQKASQMGARFAATGQGEEEGTRLAQINQITEDWLDHLDSGTKTIVISSWPDHTASGDGVGGSAGGPCDLVEVAVTYGYAPFTPIIGDMLPDVIHLRGADRKLNEPWKPCGD